jgi:carbamate kinase
LAGNRIVVALGGNALARAGGPGDWAETVEQMRRTTPALVEIVKAGHTLVLSHGNGPQVGRSLQQNEIAQRQVPARPMDVLGAETEGQIGYLIQRELGNALRAARVDRTVVSWISQTVVSARDAAFRRPTKPVGRYYNETEARLLRKGKGWTFVHDPARGGWRRVVASPRPLRWVEAELLRELLDRGLGRRCIPVVSGGGGVPVIEPKPGRLEGVEAVIDKDLAAAKVADAIGADVLALVTDVPAVSVGFRRPWERDLGEVSSSEMKRYLDAGEFGEGTMLPKVEAGLEFIARPHRRALITDPPHLAAALRGTAGTRIIPGR